jgi:hypothetical protein
VALKYAFHKLNGFPNSKLKEFFVETLVNGEAILNSQALKQSILLNRYPVKPFLRPTRMVLGMYDLKMPLEELYNLIMSGKEKSNNDGQDHEIDLLVNVKRMPDGVLGSMTPGNPWYNLSINFLEACHRFGRPNDLFGNNFHEYNHHLGLYHTTKIKSKRQYDPAYTNGRIGRNLYSVTYMSGVREAIFHKKMDDTDQCWLNQSCLA